MKTKIPQIILLTLDDLWSEDAARVEEFIEQQQQRIEELENALVSLGYCTKCSMTPEHHIDEPFSSCACGTGEDHATRPLQRMQIRMLTFWLY